MRRLIVCAVVLVSEAACGSPRETPDADASASDVAHDTATIDAAHDASRFDVVIDASPADVAVASDVGFDAARDAAVDARSPDAGSGGFVHPGVLVDREQLEFVRLQTVAGAAPWTAALAHIRSSRYGSLTYTPHPFAVVQCGFSNMPNIGCTEEMDDAIAAYTLALLWYHTGNAAYAERAIVVMNAWSAMITGHTDGNARLQSAWVTEVVTRAAEIIRHTYTGWSGSDVARFTTMLTNVYLPEITAGDAISNGNWELSMTEGVIGIGVFTDNRTLFDHGVAMWRARVPAYVYLTSDGAMPIPPPGGHYTTPAAVTSFWYGQTHLVDGLSQETCRDLGHVALGLGAAVNAAETARIQGVDLYTEQATRLTRAFEFEATYLNGASTPSWLCGGTLALGGSAAALTWEIGYNAYAMRAHTPLPQTLTWIMAHRPTVAALQLDWETLTHAGTGMAGIH